MTEKEKDAVQLPDNAFRELHDGEEYKPIMGPEKTIPEVTAWSVTWGLLMVVLFLVSYTHLTLPTN